MSSEKNWIYSTNIYVVNLRQYTEEGTFRAFAGHLPRLKEMGVETLWFMPVTPISKKEMKGTLGSYYACSDYTAVNPEFGSLQDFRELVEMAHDLEFRVIIDWVANHTGWDHVWSRNFPEWYEREPNGVFKRASGMDDIIELDFTNKQMRAAMIEAMKFWVRECDIDGFRCDLAFWVELDFWLEAIPAVNELKPLFWLAEMDPIQHPDYMQVFDAAYSWEWMHQSADWYKNGSPLSRLTHVLTKYENTPGIKAWFTSNHDENSWNGTEYEKYGGSALPLAVHSCTWPGIPLVYSGQELPNRKRLKFFDKDVIEWTGHCELHSFYRDLLQLRRNSPALDARAEVFPLHTTADENIVAFVRKEDQHEVVVLLNLSPHIVRFDIASSWIKGIFTELFTGKTNDFTSDKSFEMKAWEYLVYATI